MRRWMPLFALMFPALSSAQLLDFDSVCASPPCAIGSLYAPSGVTFSPNTAPIVAAGTNGLTGPVGGGRYLSIATFPYQTTISLARQATYVSMQLARASASSGTVTVTVTFLKAGVPVGNGNVVLTDVNTWSVVNAPVPGGVDAIFLDPSGGANLTFGIDGIQFGGTCNGFADVQPTDSFCNATEWLANRGITLGCAAGQYCPSQNVTRAQMALFMNRLGDSLSPVLLSTTGAQPGTFQALTRICETADAAVAATTRVATGTASLHAVGATGNKTLMARLGYSLNGGDSWLETPGFFFAQTVQPGIAAAWSETMLPLNVNAGNRIRFALGVQQTTYGGSVNNAAAEVQVECEISIRLDNRIRNTPPFDPTAGAQQVQAPW